MTAATLPDLLAERLRADPTAPLLTFYDDATNERTELSATSFGNWVAKTANLLVEELDLDPDGPGGGTVLLDLPTHWLVPVFLAGAWTAGLPVTTSPDVEHGAVVTGPDSLSSYAALPATGVPVLVSALRPMALRSTEQLPPGVLDHGTLWPGQGDEFVSLDPPTGATPAWRDSDGSVLTHADLLARATAADYAPGSRLLTDRSPAGPDGAEVFPGPLVTSGSLVLVRHAAPGSWEQRAQQERATDVTRS